MPKVLKRSTRKGKARTSPEKGKVKSTRKGKARTSPEKRKVKSARKGKARTSPEKEKRSSNVKKSSLSRRIRSSIRKVRRLSPKKSPFVPRTPDYAPPNDPDVIIRNIRNKNKTIKNVYSLEHLYKQARKMFKSKNIVFYDYNRCCIDNDHIFNKTTELKENDIEALISYDKKNQIDVYMKK